MIVRRPILGMDMDSFPAEVKDTSVRFRLNAERPSDNAMGLGTYNARGNEKITDIPKEIVGEITIVERDWVIFLSKDDGKDAIGYVDFKSGEYKEIMNAQEFGCAWNFQDCEFINIAYDYISGCNELKLYFSSNWTYYNVNIDEMIDPERKAGLLSILQEEGECGITSCRYFKSFNCACGTKAVTIKSDKGGYNLLAGTYQVAIRLLDMNGAKTRVFQASEPINIGSENNIPGERSTEYISIHLDNLGCGYHMVEIIIIKTVAGVTIAEIVAKKHFSNTAITYDYYGTTGREVPIPLTEVVGPGATLLEGQDQFIYNNKMWYYNLKPTKNPDLQAKILDQTKVNLVVNQVPYEDVMRFGMKSLMRGERYLYGVSYTVCGKGDTPVYVLRPNGTPSTLDLDNSGERFEMRVNGGVVRWRGASSDVNLSMRSTGTCGVVQVESVCGAADDGRSVLDQYIKRHVESMGTTVKDIARVLDCEEMDCGGGICTDADCDGPCISNCDECECEYRRKRAQEVRKTVETGVEGCSITMTQYLAGLAVDDTSVSLTAGSLKEAALNLIEKGVIQREQKKSIAQRLTTEADTAVLEFVQGDAGESPEDIYNRNVVKLGTAPFISYKSEETYPDTLNCEGQPIYGSYANKPIELFEVPSAKEIPLIKSYSYGVISPHGNRPEWGSTYINLLGLEVSDIYIPTTEELGGELCKVNIVMVERTWLNSTIVAKGIIHQTFEGIINRRVHAFPRHAVNSEELIDRFINNEQVLDRYGLPSRKGSLPASNNKFIFHSLDTSVYHMGLAATKLVPELTVYGGGWRYGLYSEGPQPLDGFYGTKTDMRGARSATHLSDSVPSEDGEKDISGITYARANSVVTPPKGIDLPLMNRYREGSVYLQTVQPLRLQGDFSFTGDVLNHSVPINSASTEYVSLRREIADQYGSLVNQNYISTGLELTKDKLSEKRISGVMGDVYVGYTTVKRTSYISDKVGGQFGIPAMVPTKQKTRSVCDSPEDFIEEEMGFYYKTKLPEDGDAADAKNWAGLHTDDDSKSWTYLEVTQNETLFPRSEYYYPRVLTHLNHYWGEFKACPWLLQTGIGDQKEIKDVYYPNLKDVGLDPTIDGRNFDECFLSNFRYEVPQPSKAQLFKKFLIKLVLNILIPALDLAALAFVEEGVGTAVYTAAQPLLTGAWLYLKEGLLTGDKIDELLGLPTCKIDEEGSQDETQVIGFKDNYAEYNTDYSSPNRVNVFFGITDPYYTCDCEDLINGATTSEIKWSNPKLLGSTLDNYLAVSPFSSTMVPSKFGAIKKLFTESGRFYAHTNKLMLLLQEGRLSIPTVDGQALSIGGGNLLEIPESLYSAVPEGFMGLQDPNASITTPFGQIFIDSDARAIYIMRSGQVKNIATKKISRFLWNNIPLDCVECRDERKDVGYLFGLDYEKRMLYFTKRDCGCSFTLGYSLDEDDWYSFFSFIPEHYVWTRSNMYTVKDGALWRHNTGTRQNFYDVHYPHIIEMAFAEQLPIEFKSLILDTVAFEGGLIDTYHTFGDMAMYTMTQSSGNQKLVLRQDTENLREGIKETANIRVDKDGRMFKINQIRNNAKYGEIITEPACTFNKVLDVNSAEKFEEQFYDDYIIVRLTHDDNKELLTRSAMMHTASRVDG